MSNPDSCCRKYYARVAYLKIRVFPPCFKQKDSALSKDYLIQFTGRQFTHQ